MDKLKVLAISLVMSSQLGASTFFMPDSDTTALITLVSTTAATVSNTLQILEVAKETQEQIDKYNNLVMRRYFIARRIEQHARDIVAISKMNPKGLRELNYAMLSLKNNLRGLKSSIDTLGKDIFEAENFTDRFLEKLENSEIDGQDAHYQEQMSSSEGTMAKHVQNTAMNTAMSSKILNKIRQDNLEYQKVDIQLKKDLAKEKIRKEQHYRDWIGLQKKEERKRKGKK